MIKGDERRKASCTIRCVREERMDMRRLISLERFVWERRNFVLSSLIYFEPVEIFENRRVMVKIRSFGDGTCS